MEAKDEMSARTKLGLSLTVAWLAVMLLMIVVGHRPDKINEWGDFFAGFFAPIAFLWLVLGYLQQGDELRLSTKALRLQAQELRNSVEQQRQLVEVSREQVQQEIEALHEERARRRAQAQPKFVLQDGGTSWNGEKATYTASVENLGSSATQVAFDFDPPMAYQGLKRIASFPSGTTRSFEFIYAGGQAREEALLVVRYLDADGLPGEAKFRFVPLPGTPNLVEVRVA